MRLRLESDGRVAVDLCDECLRNQVVLTAREEGEEAAVIREAANRIGGSVWRERGMLFLMRGGSLPELSKPVSVALTSQA